MSGNNNTKKRKLLPVTIAIALLLLVAVGGTLAWLTAESNLLNNILKPANVDVEIEEKFENNVKENVRLQNTGNVDAYVRVALLPTWRDQAGQLVGAPVSLDDLAIEWGTGWLLIGNYYYYTQPVPAAAFTEYLIRKATVKNSAGEGYQLDLQIIADSIQAQPLNAVQETWQVTLDSNGHIIGGGGGRP